ncbi:DNRLRE domain-containing protein [Rubritalea spongiae]|uniref:DNRLRE domain-containing protein n=1 Tax=Rubritalea spongiae TaxID=430797 RepID=A0ABW5E4U9_9BACT
MKNKIITLSLFSVAASTAFSATTLNPTFDTDSYVYVGTNSQYDPQLTIGESFAPAHHHFNFAVIEFDVSTLTSGNSHSLSLSAVQYINLVDNGGGIPTSTPSSTGSATLQIVALGSNFTDDYLTAGSKTAWYDTYVQNNSVSTITANFTDLETVSVDVSSIVDSWISSPGANNGFAIFSSSGNIELASSTHGTESLRPNITSSIAAVPEPSSTALLGLGGVALIFRRRRNS